MRAEINLNTFDSIEDEKSELPVKHIERPNHFESRAFNEALVLGTPINGNWLALEDALAANQTVLAYVRKVHDKLVAAGYEAPLLNEQIHLLRKGEPKLGVLHGHSKIRPQKEDPPVCMLDRTEARRVC